MRPLRTRLLELRQVLGTPLETLERDYLLSWVLFGLSQEPGLADALAFKGGTALKKCYFGDYRFSEDLDFSATDPDLAADLALRLTEAVRQAEARLRETGPFELQCAPLPERGPHPSGQQAFVIRARFPYHSTPMVRVKAEVTFDEPVLLEPATRAVIHEGFEEELDAAVRTYRLEEIVAEKLRALLQHARLLEERGWTRSRARDYYDLWRIFQAYEEELSLDGFVDLLERKCATREVRFDGADSFFDESMVAYVRDTWYRSLGSLVPDLPDQAILFAELRERLAELLG